MLEKEYDENEYGDDEIGRMMSKCDMATEYIYGVFINPNYEYDDSEPPTVIVITPKVYWDEEHEPYDQHCCKEQILDILEKEMKFNQVMESHFEGDMEIEQVREKLNQYPQFFKEVKELSEMYLENF